MWSHEVISYTGDSVDDRLVATSIPLDVGAVAVWVMHVPSEDGTSAQPACFKNSAVTGNSSFQEVTGAPITNGIKTFVSGGFTVGTDPSVNSADAQYLAIVIRDTVGKYMQVGVYTGTSLIEKNVGFNTGGSVFTTHVKDGNTPTPIDLWGYGGAACAPGANPPWSDGSFGSIPFNVWSVLGHDPVAKGAASLMGPCWRMDPFPPFAGQYLFETDLFPSAPDGGGSFQLMSAGQQCIVMDTHLFTFGAFTVYTSLDFPVGSAMEFRNDTEVFSPPGGAGPGLITAGAVGSSQATNATVGPSQITNAFGVSFAFVRFNTGSPGFPTTFRSFSGVGTGSDVAITGLGFTPGFALARRFGLGQSARFRTTVGTPGTYHTGTESQQWSVGSGGERDTTQGIKSMDADGITLGTNVADTGVPFYGFAFATTGHSTDTTEVIGPLVWMEWPRRVPLGTIVTDIYADQDMQCPASWHGGFKEARIVKAGTAERALSDPRTGDWTGSTFDITLSDYDRSIRQRLVSAVDRYWTQQAITVRMTTRDNREALGMPYTAFVGPIIDAQPVAPLAFQLTLGDAVSRGLLSDNAQQPWRLVRDGFLDELTEVSQSLNSMQPEPIIYGEHRRQVGDSGSPIEPDAPYGYVYRPIYLGVEGDRHIWLVCGHAVADIPDIFVDGVSVAADEGTAWQRPGYTNPAYEDRRSSTYGIDRRYTLIYGIVGQTDPDACAAGTAILTIEVDGIEPCGDGSGAVITNRLDQYKHFIVNYVANTAALSYQSGAWLRPPNWTIFDGDIPIVDETSWDTCKAIARIRMPSTGYIGAAVIGYIRASVRKVISDWNRSCSTRFGETRNGQLCVVMLHPTAVIKAAAPLYTAAHEILKESFGTRLAYDEMTNRIPFVADFYGVLGKWMTTGVAEDGIAIERYGDIVGEQREYPFAPGFTAAEHLAHMAVLQSVDPPRIITLAASCGPFNQTSATDPGESLGYLDLGDYVRYEHYAEVGAPAEMRVAWVVTHRVQVGAKIVVIEALDCEELIDFDLPEEEPSESGSPSNDICADAIVITEAEATQVGGYEIVIDTSMHATDGSAPVLSCGAGVAYHAQWFSFTPTTTLEGNINTTTSDYDTVLGLFAGACGALTELACNDNNGVLKTSRIELGDGFFFESGVTHKILVHGYGPEDGGRLVFTLRAEPL